ncbi:RagB/SusD family nutrient uptake outer membrane protein [Dysgonomonas sp. Marseille-P4677]|uniref:RagB/SusD family nutrient uptake outer membrane protein n=1 Tax=Dysgonomonas sp. Marseille-P4677 TaxID=2364790 RepID=UPI00351C7B7D
MKNNIYIILIGLFFGLSACNDYEEVPVEKYTLEYVFSDRDSLGVDAQKYLNSVYSVLRTKMYGHNRIDGDYLDAATDDAVTSVTNNNQIKKLSAGQYTASTRISQDMSWGEFYTGIRRANTFINNIDIVPLKERFNNHVAQRIPMNRAWKAEARFLKALYYFELVKRYGGVPLVGDIPYELDQSMELPRNKFEECIDYIVSELDVIKDSLRSAPVANINDNGHVVTAGAAMALKVRVLLYAASPLFNGNTLDANNPYVGYTDYKAERWQKAANAAEQFMAEWGPDGTYQGYELMSDFRDVFLQYYNANAKEVIFHVQGGSGNKDVEMANGPYGYSGNAKGNARTSPTQDLVNAFPMKDGKAIGQSSKYPYSFNASMYDNRDPRLDYTILHQGSHWLSSILATYEGGRSNPAGISETKTRTSYYMRKFMGKFENEVEYSGVTRNWVVFRYAEILLNYAEAQNEYDLSTGKSTVNPKVLNVIREIRKRAGIEGDDGTYGIDNNVTCQAMQELIRNERRIEMAFEEHRYWDIRRWRKAEEIFNKPIKGLTITLITGNMQFMEKDILDAKFDTRRYLYPIPYSEVNKNSNLVQNPMW